MPATEFPAPREPHWARKACSVEKPSMGLARASIWALMLATLASAFALYAIKTTRAASRSACRRRSGHWRRPKAT